jgi:tetratricopeptide (TPR) repeat protein
MTDVPPIRSHKRRIFIGVLAVVVAVIVIKLVARSGTPTGPQSLDVDKELAGCAASVDQGDLQNAYWKCGKVQSVAGLDTPHRVTLLKLMAQISIRRHDSAVAIGLVDEALGLAPKDATLHDLRGESYYKNDDYDLALAEFEKAIALDSQNGTFLSHRAATLAAMGDAHSAVQSLSDALRRDPGLTEAYWHRGDSEMQLHESAKAIADYNAAIGKTPNSAALLYRRALAYLADGKVEQAMMDANAAINLAPSNIYVLETRAQIYDRREEVEAALADLTTALDQPASEVDKGRLYARRASIYFDKLKNFDRAIADARQSIEHDPQSAVSQNFLCFFLARTGRAQQAMASCTRAVQLNESDPLNWRSRGYARLWLDDWSNAIADLTRANELADGGDLAAIFMRGYAHDRAGDAAAAAADYDTVRSSDKTVETQIKKIYGVVAGTNRIIVAN